MRWSLADGSFSALVVVAVAVESGTLLFPTIVELFRSCPNAKNDQVLSFEVFRIGYDPKNP